MNKLYVLLMLIALVPCVACQRQQANEQKHSEIEREIQERMAAEHQAQERHQVTQDEAKPNTREKAPETLLTPASSASPSKSSEKRYDLKSQAQKFQPRRIVPITSPIRETPTSSEPPIEKLNKTEMEKQNGDSNETVQDGEGLSNLPRPRNVARASQSAAKNP